MSIRRTIWETIRKGCRCKGYLRRIWERLRNDWPVEVLWMRLWVGLRKTVDTCNLSLGYAALSANEVYSIPVHNWASCQPCHCIMAFYVLPLLTATAGYHGGVVILSMM
jgi:hypothetical protein